MHHRPRNQSRRTLVTPEMLESRQMLAGDLAIAADATIPLITEFQASNNTTLTDEDGDTPDWIELHNPSDVEVDLTGWRLTDDASDLSKWTLPNLQLTAGAYLVVFASGKDRVADVELLHTSFKLSRGGEYLALVQADGEIASEHMPDGVDYPEQFNDLSYGHQGIDLADPNPPEIHLTDRVFFSVPTPGAANSIGVTQVLDQPAFSVEAGIHTEAFDFELTSDAAGGEIHYTLDGTQPVPGEAGTVLYEGPISVAGTTAIRAITRLDDATSIRTSTATYLFLDDVVTQSPTGEAPPNFPADWGENRVDYGMDPSIVNSPTWGPQMIDALTQIPSISVVMNVDDLFGEEGIYSHAINDGRVWEREASVELLDPDAGQEFQIDAGIRIRGGFSRRAQNAKHSFRLFFRSEYGDSRLDFPLFGDEGANSFDKVDLRTAQNHSWAFSGSPNNAFVRDVFSRDLHGQLGHPYGRSRYYHLYLNGQYWGLFQTDERKDAEFAASYLGGDPADYDVIKRDGAIDGNKDAWRRLYDEVFKDGGLGDVNSDDYFRVQGMNPDGTRNPEFERLLDVDALIDFQILLYFTGDWDSVPNNNNYYIIYNRENPDGFQFIDHDSEHSLEVGRPNLVTPLSDETGFDRFTSLQLHEQIVATNTEYRQHFYERAAELLADGGPLDPENLIELIDARAAEIDQAIIANSARWGDSVRTTPRTKVAWESAIAGIRNWLTGRGEVLKDQLREANWYWDLPAPEYDFEPGEVPVGAEVTLTLPSENSYDSRRVWAMDGLYRRFVPDADFEAAHGNAWVQPGFSDLAEWQFGAGAAGYDNMGDLSGLVSSQIPAGTTSVYIRPHVAFSVVDRDNDGDLTDEFETLTLRGRFDDGFVAYLNGQVIASANAPENPSFDSLAIADVPNSEATQLQTFFLDDSVLELFQPTGNVVAIHGLNDSADSDEMLLGMGLQDLTLIGTTRQDALLYYTTDGSDPRSPGGQLSPTAILSSEDATMDGPPIAITETTTLRIRTFTDGQWSLLTELTYTVPTVTVAGDATGDGHVDVRDFNRWNDNKFICDKSLEDGDFNDDGCVDAADFSIWFDNRFTSAPEATRVPRAPLEQTAPVQEINIHDDALKDW